MKLFVVNIDMAGLGLPAKYFHIHDKVLFVSRILKYDGQRIAYMAELKRNDFVEMDEINKKREVIMEKYNIEDFEIIDSDERTETYDVLIIQRMPELFTRIYSLMDYSSFITTPMVIGKEKIMLSVISKEQTASMISSLLDDLNIKYEVLRKVNLSREIKFNPRQMEIITVAIKKGYYEIPRKIKMNHLAEEFGVSITVIERVLRKAESMAIYEIFKPYL